MRLLQAYVFFVMVCIILVGIVFAVHDCKEREVSRAPAQEDFEAHIPKNWDWVTVEEPTENSDWEFMPGDGCGIQTGGMVVAIHRTDEVVTARYIFLREAYGTECPSCTLFEVAPEEWERLYQIYK